MAGKTTLASPKFTRRRVYQQLRIKRSFGW